VADSGFKSFNTITAALYEHHKEILNFSINRSPNTSAESFNAKIKTFRASLREVLDIKSFLFRVTNIYGNYSAAQSGVFLNIEMRNKQDITVSLRTSFS
jgi:hypothetical protein